MPNVNIFIERENIKKRLNAKSIEDIGNEFYVIVLFYLCILGNELVVFCYENYFRVYFKLIIFVFGIIPYFYLS